MAKTRYDKAWEILGSALSDQSASAYQKQREMEEEQLRQKLEEEKKIEEARRKANFDNVESGVTVGMSLDSYGRPQGTSFIEPKPEAPSTDDGYSIWDVGVMARQGASSLTKGVAGLPVNLGNAISAGPRMLYELATGNESEIQQPEFVKNLRSEIDNISENIYEQQASDKLKAKDKEFQAADGLWDTTKFLAKNPGYFGLQGAQQAPQLLGSGGAPGVVGKVIAGGLSAAGQVEDQTTKALREQGFSEEEIADRAAGAFGASFVLNTATPFAAKSTFLEGVLSRAARGRVTDGVIKNVLATTNREVIEGVVTETGDQLIQNLASGKPWDENLAQSATLGAAFSAAVAGPTATIESAAEAGRAAARLQEYLSNQGYNKEANDIAKATKKPVFREPVQEDMFGGRGEIPITEEGRVGTSVGTDIEGAQALLRTRADTVRAQLEADRERLAGFQTRIERAPFAEDQADLLTNQERTDMSRIQERVAGQERLLAELEAQQTPTQPGLNLQGKNQPKNPKFTGQERSVDQIKSDYFKTQPVQGPQNMTPAQRKAVQKDILEETKRTKAEQKKANDKIKAARAAARRKFLDGQRAGLLDLPVEERAKRLAEAGREWDTANPLVLPTAPVATKPAAAPAEAQEAEASVPVSTLTEGLQGTPQGTVPLPSTAQAPAQGTTLEDVRKAVGGGKRDKLASRLSYMVEDGNLEIVESQDQIPGDIGEMEEQGSGWYDPNTGKSYIVASNLNPENIRGDILSALAHETKHGGDFGGSKGLARSFKPFIGSKANKEMVEKIKKAAKAGDTSAKFALRAVLGDEQNQDNKTVYQKLDHTEDQVNSEIVANYLTAEHKKSGVKTSLYRGIVSPLRVGAKKLLGSNDVSLGDIHYLADRLVSEVAQRGERIKPSGGNALPMTISGGRTEAEQIRNNRTWLSADKKRKYEISDKDSSVEIPGDYMDRDFKAKEILKHDKLYNELPELADTTIRFAELDPSTGGQYSKEDNVITINTATNEFKRGRNMYNGLIHQYILHEMQHRAQGVSGTTPGASPTFFLPNEAKRLENDIEDLAFAINYGKSTGADADFLERQRQEMSQKEQEYLQKYGPNTPAYEAATIQYEKVLGELEAYRTNNNLTKTEAELDETGLGQQEVQWDSEGGITTETGKRIRPTTRPRQKAAAMPSMSDDQAPPKPRYKYNGKDTVYQWQRDRAIEEEYEASKRAERDARRQRAWEDQQVEDASRRSFLKKAAGVAVTAAVAGGARLNNTNITLGRAKPISEAVLYSNVSPETKTLLENGDLKGALLEMANNGPKELRWLSRTLSQLLPKGTIAVIDPYTNSNAHGETYMGKDGVEIKLFTADGLRGMSHGTILHEVLHAVVMGRYRSLSSGLDHNYKLLGLTKPQALKAMDDFRSLWHEFRDEVNLSGITEEGNSPSLSEAMASPDEFFVRALTDPRLKAIMSKMAYSRGGSIYSRFKNWVKHTLFGSSGQKPSWLDAALMSTEDLLSAMGKDEADFKFINAFDKEIESSKVSNKEVKAKPMPSVAEQAEKGKVNDRRDAWGQIKDGNAAIRAISNLFSTTGGYGQQVFELLSNRSSDRAVLAYRAEELEAAMRKGIKQSAKTQGVSTKEIDNQLNTAINSINTLPNKEARDAALKSLDGKYPGVGTALVQIRDLKWSLARAVVEQRHAEGRDLSPKEANVINKMMENQETYTTRAYEAGQLDARKLAKARLARYKKNPQSEEAKQFQKDVEFLQDNYVIIPDKDKLLTMKKSELNNFYETWLGDSTGKNETDMVEELDAIPKYNEDVLQKKLKGLVRELVGLDAVKTKSVRGFVGSRQNRTVLEGRENVPPEIRRMMGEITNSVAKEVLSVARLSSLYTQNKVLAKLASDYKGILWEDHAVGDFKIPVTAENYGPMRGKFVTPAGSRVLQPIVDLGMNAEEALNTINEDGANALGKSLATTASAVQKAAGVTKVVSLIWNLGAAGANWAGAWGALTSNGVGVNKAWEAHKLTFKAIRARYNPNLYKGQDKQDVRDVILSGVLDSATTGEYQQRLFSTLFRNLEEDATPKDVMRTMQRMMKDGLLSSKDFYAFMDMWAKVGAWSDRREYLTKMYAKEGDNKSHDAIIREAGHDINASNISWVRAPAAVKAVEKYLGPLAMFFVYFMEVPRSTAYSYALALKDWNRADSLKTKEAKNLAKDAALRRLAGTTMYIAGITGTMAYLLNGMGEDEERRRETDPEWEQKGLNLPLGKTEDGKDIQYNALRVDFIGPLNELLTKLATQDEDDTSADIIKSYVTDQFVKNRALFSLMRSVKSLAGMETTNFDDSDSELVDRLDQLSWGDDQNLGKNLADTVDKFTPSTPRGIYKTIKGVTGAEDYKFSVKDNPIAAAIQATGLKLSVRDPERSLEFSVSAYNKAKKEAMSDLSATKKRFARLDGKDLIEELDDVITDEREAYKALHKVYDGVVAFNGYYEDKNYSEAARKVLKAKKVGPVQSDLQSGVFNIRFISRDYISDWEAARRARIKELPDDKKSEEAAKLRSDVRAVKDYLNSRSK